MQTWHYVTHKQMVFELKSSRENIWTFIIHHISKKNIFLSSYIKNNIYWIVQN